jgi:hypothetical protein
LLFSFDYEPPGSKQSEEEPAYALLERLRKKYDPKGERLGDKPEIVVQEQGKWLIYGKDKGRGCLFQRKRDTYLLRKAGDKLVVYKPRSPSWGGLAETVSVMNGVLFGILLVLSVLGCAHLVTSKLNALCVGCALKLNSFVIVCALVTGLFGLVGAIIVQCLLMVKFYEEYDIHVPEGDSPSNDNSVASSAGK